MLVVLDLGPPGGFELGCEGAVEVSLGGGLRDFFRASTRGFRGGERTRVLVLLRAGDRERVR